MNQMGILAMLLASTALPDRQELSDDLDRVDILGWADEGILVLSFCGGPDPGWYGAIDIVPPPLEERLRMIVPVERTRSYGRTRDVHQPPPRVLGRKDYSRLDFRKFR